MTGTPEERKAARKARIAKAQAALQDDAAETVEDFVSSGRAEMLMDCLEDIEELQTVSQLSQPAERCASAIRTLLRSLKSVPDEREETWAARNLPPED